MATQTLSFGYTTGTTLTAQLFAVGSDTATATASAVTEATNREGRYNATFTDVAAGSYLLVYFVGGVGAGSEYFTLTLETATFRPWSEQDQSAGIAGITANGVAIAALPTAVQNADKVNETYGPLVQKSDILNGNRRAW